MPRRGLPGGHRAAAPARRPTSPRPTRRSPTRPADGASGTTTAGLPLHAAPTTSRPPTALTLRVPARPAGRPDDPAGAARAARARRAARALEPVTEHWEECASPVRFPYMLSGEHRFEVRATDPYDNIDLTPGRVRVERLGGARRAGLDARRSTTIVGGPDRPEPRSRSATLPLPRVRQHDARPGPALRVPARRRRVQRLRQPRRPTRACRLGDHTFEVRALDVQGNRDAVARAARVDDRARAADTNPPETTIDVGPDPRTVADRRDVRVLAPTRRARRSSARSTRGDYADCELAARVHRPRGRRPHRARAGRSTAAGNRRRDARRRYTWTIGAAAGRAHRLLRHDARPSASASSTTSPTAAATASSSARTGITIDLNGRTIDGGGSGAGIRNDGFDHVTITGDGTRDRSSTTASTLDAGTADNIVADVDGASSTRTPASS